MVGGGGVAHNRVKKNKTKCSNMVFTISSSSSVFLSDGETGERVAVWGSKKKGLKLERNA